MKKTCIRRYKLTPDVQKAICDFIRAGGFPEVAAEAAGIPQEVFDDWLRRGTATRQSTYSKPYIAFRQEVTRATAEARLAAEVQAHKQFPITWLKQGPGKETPNKRGWTVTVQPSATTTHNQQINLLLSPEFQGIFAALLQVLAPFPEARAAVAQALAGVEQPKMIEASVK